MLILNSHVGGILHFFACTEFLRKRVKHFIPIKNKMIRCPKNVGRLISEYVDRKKKILFLLRVYAQTWPGPFLTHVTIEIGLSHIFRSNSFKTHK